MGFADALRSRDGHTEVDITVSPRSSRSGIDGFDEWRKRIIVRVKAPPLEGRANREVADVFRDATGMRSEVVAGQTSHQKTVAVEGDLESVVSALGRFF
jgi:uncharacterized protein (TIGR00251 family)